MSQHNHLVDVAGLRVGHASDAALKSGVSVVVADTPFVAGVHVMGGAPGARDTELLAPQRTVAEVDALVLSGGSAFGLAAADGVMEALAARGRGFAVGAARVPIAPSAILFDLANGGDKGWQTNPYPALGRAALDAAFGAPDVRCGSLGAGTGATCASLKGGLGSASCVTPSGVTVAAMVAVNAVGDVCGPDGRFHAAPFEEEGEFGGDGISADMAARWPMTKLGPAGQATTIAVIGTDAALDKAQATALSVAAHDGMARSIRPSHTPMDGDLVFTAATGGRDGPDSPQDWAWMCHAAATCLARAIARGVYAADKAPGDTLPTWAEKFGR